MKYLIILIVILSACTKETSVPVKYEVNSECSQVNVVYYENGKEYKQTVTGRWTHEFIRETGDASLKASTVCVGANSSVTISGYVDGKFALNDRAENGEEALFSWASRDLDKKFR
jgi:hypothetical protein